MRYKGSWVCKKSCEYCEGKGYVVSGMTGAFNSRSMDFDFVDEYEPCENAKWDEPDEDYWRD